MKFVDEVTIEVASGRGGPGSVSFRREKYVPRGGPDGGDGGRGGHVVFKTSERLHSLLDFKYRKKYAAKNGEQGGAQNCTGADGEDLILEVPNGTIIKDESGRTLHDLQNVEALVFLEGGLGGKGNSFYKTSVNQAPGIAQKGLPGESMIIKLELKLIADVGIIGFPNAGKSTIISRISAAKPKVADYPFTTLVPNLGVVPYGNDRTYVVADMPGLIKGAHEGTGLGTRFLKHIERTACFLHMIDASGMSGRKPIEDYHDINFELKMYDKAHEHDPEYIPLANRRQIVALNKIDTIKEADLHKLIKKFEAENVEVFPVSAVTGKNVEQLIYKLGDMVFHGEEENNKS